MKFFHSRLLHAGDPLRSRRRELAGQRGAAARPLLLPICLLMIAVAPTSVTMAQRAGGFDSVDGALAAILAVGPEGRGHQSARAAVAYLSQADPPPLGDVLAAMSEANPLAKNWLMGSAGTLRERLQQSDPDALAAELESVLENREADPDARYLVFRWLTEEDASRRARILARSSDDPSLPLRFLANEQLMERAEGLRQEDPDKAGALFSRVLSDARNPEQLRAAANALAELGREVDLAAELGMFSRWYLVAPFDNTDGSGFDQPLGPEKTVAAGEATIQLDAEYTGKATRAAWRVHRSEDPMGMVDLNPLYDNAKDAIAYAYCEFTAESAAEAEARLGCICANKVWINGDLVIANEVYHAGSRIDQYVGPCQLRAGKNWVLVKICQNAQTEAWAQDWEFQFRITDATGKPLPLTVVRPTASEVQQ